MFEDNDIIEVLWKKQLFLDKILEWTKSAVPGDLLAGAELLAEVAGLIPSLSIRYRLGLEHAILACAQGVGLRDLEVFAALLAMPPAATAPSSAA